ncbi:hypothetical protein EBQ81_00125 [bacterium]|nr:hypothetical protein [bacterium]
MNITCRKSVRQELVARIPELLDEAMTWMKAKYPSVDFGKVEFIFSGSYNRSRYFRNELNPQRGLGKYIAPNACISTRAWLILYDMKSLCLKKTKLFVGSEIQMVCALIHELTHHAQYELGLPTGELETTRNELDYLKENHMEFWAKLVGAKIVID